MIRIVKYDDKKVNVIIKCPYCQQIVELDDKEEDYVCATGGHSKLGYKLNPQYKSGIFSSRKMLILEPMKPIDRLVRYGNHIHKS